MNAPAMKRLSAGLRLLVLLAAACLALVLPAVAADEVTAPPGDTGEQLKSKTEQMNDSFSSLVDTIAADDSDTFSPAQKKHLQGLRDQAKNETARTPPQEFKHQSRNRRVDCVIRERLGDVDDKGKPLGNEDGLCDGVEMAAGGCAEVLDDGIGDDDGICESKGKFDEACVEDCDVDLTMAAGKEDNVHPGKRADLEQSLDDMTGVLDEANGRLKTHLAASKKVMAMAEACDQSTMGACDYLQCIMADARPNSADVIEGLIGGAAGAKTLADGCRDMANWDLFTTRSWICIVPGLIANGLEAAAVYMETKDDARSSARLDATAACVSESGDQLQTITTSLEGVVNLLRQPPGQRQDYPLK